MVLSFECCQVALPLECFHAAAVAGSAALWAAACSCGSCVRLIRRQAATQSLFCAALWAACFEIRLLCPYESAAPCPFGCAPGSQ